MQIVDLRAEHCMNLGTLVPVHSGYQMTPDLAVELESIGGLAALDNGKTLAVAGVLPDWRACGTAWAWLGRGWRKHARAITSAACIHLDMSPLRRVETAVRCDFEPGHRWAERLGFTLETPCARSWGADGRDYSIYVRVRES